MAKRIAGSAGEVVGGGLRELIIQGGDFFVSFGRKFVGEDVARGVKVVSAKAKAAAEKRAMAEAQAKAQAADETHKA